MISFWIQEAVTATSLCVVAWLLGILVLRCGVRVNYTRKILRILLFVVPLALFEFFPYTPTVTTCIYKGSVLLALFMMLSHPVRSRISPARTCFAALDRPEDRPYTLWLLITQAAACTVVIILAARWLELYSAKPLLLIGLLVDGLGDALAEPIGVRFGRHAYKTRSLFSTSTHRRTLEGSACVYLSAVLGILLVRDCFSSAEFAIAIAAVPVVVTAAEAWSPHTWDGPFLHLTSASACIAILELSRWLQAV